LLISGDKWGLNASILKDDVAGADFEEDELLGFPR
jgi:hypothetical protein